MSTREQEESITLLGNQGTKYPDDYAPEVLESFENKHPGNDYYVKFNCSEFTSLCPITGQPDFAKIKIAYIPDKRMVESKSLKLYEYYYERFNKTYAAKIYRGDGRIYTAWRNCDRPIL